ncbi:tellurite resistance/C4-dicarboxylate transporter family protein [Solicola gregarius]|uniref:Tellurite resistance/C4-dicarboxylate transporter family protein n=1 Tax=Solicola gregarius TaxID=2908642 RepID=A0AA46TMA3_9ACTN|nr:tellurite resistance/C4-dicarboxylate transporter family protein [Solicola gregarius]UYM07906.1 tellurite resistance/C4-dicarboxylate transporter family protein [Solicola gregarius]
MRVLDRARGGVRTLAPVYFALVMASGAISVALHAADRQTLSRALFVVASVAYLVLLAMTIWRAVAFPRQVVADARDPQRAFGFFTVVAGSTVLGDRLVVAGQDWLAYVLLVAAAAVWLVLGYLVPWMTLVRHDGPTALRRADGSWFIWAVASQSIAVLAGTLEPGADHAQHGLAFLAFVAWAVGCFLYVTAVVLVGLRLVLYEVEPADFGPAYWVAMGAASITVLAGVRVAAMQTDVVADVVHDIATGASLMFWAFASWLFPVLVAAGWWRHGVHHVRLTYQPALWSMVFPLGMYALASISLGDADELSWIAAVGRAEVWFALAVWVVTFAAMCVHLYRGVRTRPARTAP